MTKYYEIKALTNFFWKSATESAMVKQGEIIEVDSIARKQLVKEKKLCEDMPKSYYYKTLKRKAEPNENVKQAKRKYVSICNTYLECY